MLYHQQFKKAYHPQLLKVKQKNLNTDDFHSIDMNFDSQYIAYSSTYLGTIILKKCNNEFIFHQKIVSLKDKVEEIIGVFGIQVNRMYISYQKKETQQNVIKIFSLQQNGFWEEEYQQIIEECFSLIAILNCQFAIISKSTYYIKIYFENKMEKKIENVQVLKNNSYNLDFNVELDWPYKIEFNRLNNILISYSCLTLLLLVRQDNNKWKKWRRIQFDSIENTQIIDKILIVNNDIYWSSSSHIYCLKLMDQTEQQYCQVIKSKLKKRVLFYFKYQNENIIMIEIPVEQGRISVKKIYLSILTQDNELQLFKEIYLPFNKKFFIFDQSQNQQFLYCAQCNWDQDMRFILDLDIFI